jgi:hypothetical protein
MRIPLTSVANEQIVTIRVSNVNGSSGSDDVDFGFLIADANASRTVDRPDLIAVRSQRGQPVTAANFRDDITRDGVIGRPDRRKGDSCESRRKPKQVKTLPMRAVIFRPSRG